MPCDVFTRAWSDDLAPAVEIEPGVRVLHVEAGPRAELPKEALPEVVPAFTEGVLRAIRDRGDVDAE